jgi:hypothetical protein
MSRRNLQSDTQGLPLRSSEQLKAGLGKSERESNSDASFRSSEQPTDALSESEQRAARLLDAAFSDPNVRLTNKEIAHLCRVSESLVEKWRSTTARGCPSYVQMLLLPPAFWWALNKAMNKEFGYARAALIDLIDAAGALAVLCK